MQNLAKFRSISDMHEWAKDFRNGNIVAKHGAYQTDLHWLCQKEIGLLAEMLKESRYLVSQICSMSSNITLQILQRRLESDFLKYLEM